jgi:hypothetical protein
MMPAKSFGRRATDMAPKTVWREAAQPATIPGLVAARPAEPLALSKTPDEVDEELKRWKDERRRTLAARIPWRQISLMASICFGAASFVLPDSVNGAVDWVLYALSAASLWAWYSGRKKKKAAP